MKKYASPIITMIVTGWLSRLEGMFLTGSARSLIVTFTIAMGFFALGICLQPRRKNRTWVQKLVVSFVFLFFVLWELGYLSIPFLSNVLDTLGYQHFVIYMIYVFCGWLFFD